MPAWTNKRTGGACRLADPEGPRQIGLARGFLVALIALVALVPTATASSDADLSDSAVRSSTGGVTVGTSQPPGETGGTREGAADPDTDQERKRRSKKRRGAPTVLTKFSLGANSLFDEGRPLPVRFRVRGRGKQVHVWLVAQRRGGARTGSVDLGLQPTNKTIEIAVGEDRLGIAGEGRYQFRLAVRDRSGRRAARASGVSTWITVTYANHRFPLAGEFSWGNAGSRFGAARDGHRHQGQDLSAAEGTPIVAPHAGVISWISYQAAGAGHYLVLDSAGEDRDYVFMHLKAGSINVRKGEKVETGKLLGKVGNSGRSFGAHLHFEVWTGGHWQSGGHPIDPYPLLRAWFKAAPGGANTLTIEEEAAGDPVAQ